MFTQFIVKFNFQFISKTINSNQLITRLFNKKQLHKIKRQNNLINKGYEKLLIKFMSKIDKSRTPTSYEQMNFMFYREFLSWAEHKQDAGIYKKMSKKGQQIHKQLDRLSQSQRQQWQYTYYLKINRLFNPNTQPPFALLQSLLILINQCKKFKIEYNYEKINQIVKEAFYQKYKTEISQLMIKCGFKIDDLKTWEYQDSWFSKIWRYITE